MVPEIKHSLEYRILTCFELLESDIPALEKYYLLHWSGDYFRRLYENSPRFQHQGIQYQILFFQGDVCGILTAKNVAVSFRKLAPQYPYGYAMVKAL